MDYTALAIFELPPNAQESASQIYSLKKANFISVWMLKKKIQYIESSNNSALSIVRQHKKVEEIKTRLVR